jgi:hypothetical protein
MLGKGEEKEGRTTSSKIRKIIQYPSPGNPGGQCGAEVWLCHLQMGDGHSALALLLPGTIKTEGHETTQG